MAHDEYDEFPPLTPAASAVLDAAFPLFEEHGEMERRVASAVIRAAIMQLGTWKVSFEFPKVLDANDLEAIADNLHSPPPPPPTKDQMEIALGRLLQHTNDPAGCHECSLIAELANVLRRGIAHYCKEQP